MISSNIEFQTIDWKKIKKTMHMGDPGAALRRLIIRFKA